MLFWAVAVSVAVGAAARSPFADYRTEGNVIKATPAVVTELRARYPWLVVFFHSPSCAHCEEFAHAFGDAARRFESTAPLLPLAALDCSAAEDFCHHDEEVGHYPLLRVYFQGLRVAYRGGPSANAIVRFVQGRTHRSALRMTDVARSAEALLARGELVALFRGGPDAPDFAEFRKAAFLNEAAHFFFTAEPRVQAAVADLCRPAAPLPLDGSLLLLEREERVCHQLPGRVEHRQALAFLALHEKPGLVRLDGRAMRMHAFHRQPVVVFFAERAEEHAFLPALRAMARRHKPALIFAFVDAARPLGTEALEVLELVGVDRADFPCLRAFSLLGGEGRKWRPESLEPAAVADFVAQLAAGKARPYLKAQARGGAGPLPSISGEEFHAKVLGGPFPVALLLVGSAETCPRCAEFELAAAEAHRQLLARPLPLYKLNVQLNEVPGWSFTARPEVAFFLSATDVRSFGGGAVAADIRAFLERHLRPVDEL